LGTHVRLDDVPTPFALIDARRLRRNIAGMQQAVASIGASLRPHFKTHRTMAIARLQRDAGAIGVTVATVPQLAAVERDLGCPVLVSSLLQVDAATAHDLHQACARGRIAFSVESTASIERLRSALGPELTPDVMIEVEAGCLRSGVQPSDCAELARTAARLGCRVAGLFSYPGQSYIPDQAKDASDQELAALELGAAGLHRAGFDPEHISAGSTPTMRFARSGIATEYRPGTYVFGDRQQLGLGAMERTALALTVVATVVALSDDRLVLDAGGKALGRDAPRWLPGYGQLVESSGALITRLYDHHAVIESYRGHPVTVGDRLAILPNNANSVMALLRSAWLSEDGESAVELMPQADR
jgi:D-serine deaminase-like pyridoxal phosphate-dependent protein